MRLLLVEDDTMIGQAVLALLRGEGYVVDWVQDGAQADTALHGHQYDLVLLDLGLPKLDGLQVLRQLRARKDATPVLVATARDAVRDRIAGLDAGADDYVIKPYDMDELLARIRALTRRAAGHLDAVYEHGGVMLNPNTREASVNGQPVTLSGREWAVLQALLARPGPRCHVSKSKTSSMAGATRSAAMRWRSISTGCAKSSALQQCSMCAVLDIWCPDHEQNQALKRLKLPGSLGGRLLLFIGMAILLVAVLQGLCLSQCTGADRYPVRLPDAADGVCTAGRSAGRCQRPAAGNAARR
jgi:two-component system OmpR family response regulator